ncbi:MAG TPA: glycosyltransferase family A protein, partial [Gemmatimonadales bacterium]|nr:glycosyltransferase family A protein [Gemmatimonadales bacterium]
MCGLSAAICTRDRPELLARALDSLVAQTPEVAEILVVDNAPAGDATRALVATRFPSVRYVAEPVPGLDFARNRALETATREVVAFLDDDAVAAPGWADSLRRVFE